MRKKTTRVRKMGATNKRAKRVRYEGEFPLSRLAPEIRFPLRMLGDFSWDAETIRNARQDQLRGYFWSPAKLAQSMNSDAGLFTARLNRLAPLRGLPIDLRPAGVGEPTTRAMRVRDEGDALFGPNGLCFSRDNMTTLHKQYVDHGVAFGYNRWTVRTDKNGFPMRVDVETLAWPIEYVRWLPQARAFFTLTKAGQLMRMDHGDGRWVIIQQEKLDPWAAGCVVPGCMVWADRAFAIRDRSNASRAHGQPKMIGELPTGMSIFAKAADGTMSLSAEAQALLNLLQQCQIGDLPAGLRPAGSKTDQLVNTSQAWQIWENMITTNDKDSARIYLGQDGTTTNEGGNYIKSERLFGVRNDLVEADLMSFTEGFRTGVIEPWAAINFGDSTLAPVRRWLMPDADEDARRESIGAHLDKFFATIANLRDNGFEITQDVVNNVARELGVTPFKLKGGAAPSSTQAPPKSLPGATPPPASTSDSDLPIAAE